MSQHIDLNAMQLAVTLKVTRETVMIWITMGLQYYTRKGMMMFKHDDVYNFLRKNNLA
jgi:hypothetical protein